MVNRPKLGIVLNPIAGKGRAIKIEKPLIEYLRQQKIFFHLERTKEPNHATVLSSQLCKEFNIIIALGGDGTANEVVTGMLGSTSSLAILPIGSGNDFNRIIGIPRKMTLAIDTIISGTKKFFDLGRVTIKNNLATTQIKYFLNTLGIGIDAEIAKETKRIKYLRGLPLYFVAAVKALSTYSPTELNISDDGTTKKEKAYLLCAGNGTYEGGGFKMLPGANPSDSKLNICLIKKMPIWKAITVLPRIINGTHGDHKMVSLWESKKLKISSKLPFIIHGDGEIFEEKAMEATVDLLPKAINVIVPTILIC